MYATVSKQRRGIPHSAHSPPAPSPPAPSPSPHGLVNGRYAASIDSGIASSNSAGHAPVSPPTSDSSSRASGESRGTAPVAAAAARPGAASALTSTGGTPRVDARQLDELLAGMLLDIENIPDLRPCQTPAPDIDSIKCPDFSSISGKGRLSSATSSTRLNNNGEHHIHHHHYHQVQHVHSHPSSYAVAPPPPRLSPPLNGYSGSTTQDSLLDTSLSTTIDEVPYHARTDSKPFSYGAVTSSPLLNRHRSPSEGIIDSIAQPPSPSMHRRNSREQLAASRAGLESPRLVRRMSGSVGGSQSIDISNGRRSPSAERRPSTNGRRSPSMERRSSIGRRSPSPSPSPEPGSRGGTLRRERAQTLTNKIMHGEPLSKSQMTRSASRLDDSPDGAFYYEGGGLR